MAGWYTKAYTYNIHMYTYVRYNMLKCRRCRRKLSWWDVVLHTHASLLITFPYRQIVYFNKIVYIYSMYIYSVCLRDVSEPNSTELMIKR